MNYQEQLQAGLHALVKAGEQAAPLRAAARRARPEADPFTASLF